MQHSATAINSRYNNDDDDITIALGRNLKMEIHTRNY